MSPLQKRLLNTLFTNKYKIEISKDTQLKFRILNTKNEAVDMSKHGFSHLRISTVRSIVVTHFYKVTESSKNNGNNTTVYEMVNEMFLGLRDYLTHLQNK